MKTRRLGFTLVEMLVVLGIIGLMAALLLPLLGNARRASLNTKCINNLRQIGMAMSQYMADNEQTVPYAVSSNSWDDPASFRGAAERLMVGNTTPIAYDLDPYLRYEARLWNCPASRVLRAEPEKQMRVAQQLASDAVHVKGGSSPMWLSSGGFWRPGYMFVATHGWRWYYRNDKPTWDAYGMAYWKVRNVSGLRLEQIKTTRQEPTSSIVLLFDYSTKFHSKSGEDVYALQQPKGYGTKGANINRGQFQSNFLYLDGHADTRRFTWQGGLLNVIHHPIAQRWDENREGDYTRLYADAYATEFDD